MGNNLYEFIIKAKNEASKTFDKVKKDFDSMAKEYENGNKKMVEQSQKFAVALGAVGVAAAGLATKMAFDAAQNIRTQQTFKSLGDSIGLTESSIVSMRKATNGLVSDMDLMQSGNKLISMGLATSEKEMAKVMNTATRLGQAMGTGATQSMEDFALMLANQSIPRLDTFGISSGKVRARMLELTEANKGMSRETAFMTATMEQAETSLVKLGDFAPTAAERFQQVQVQIANLTQTFGEALLPIVEASIPILEAVASSMQSLIATDWNGWMQQNIAGLTALAGVLTAILYPAIVTATIASVQLVLAWTPIIATGLAVGAALGFIMQHAVSLHTNLTTLIGSVNELTLKYQAASLAMSELNNNTALSKTLFGELGGAYESMISLNAQLAQATMEYAQTQSQASIDKINLLEAELTKAEQVYNQMAESSSASSKIMLNNAELIAEAKNRLGEEELLQRMGLIDKAIDEDYKGLQEQLNNHEITQEQMDSIMKDRVANFKNSLAEELSYDGDITTARLKMLERWGQNNIDMRKIVTGVDKDELNKRLKMAQDFSIQDGRLVSKLVTFKNEMGNAELKAYGKKLSQEEKAANTLKRNLVRIFAKPVMQEIKLVGDTFAQKLLSGLSGVQDRIASVVSEATQVYGDYNMEMGAASAEFDASIEKIVAAAGGGAEAMEKMGGGAGGAAKAVSDAVGDQEKELEKLEEAAQKAADEQVKFNTMLKESYASSSKSIFENLSSLESKHTTSIDKYRDSIGKLNGEIDKLNQGYSTFVQGQAASFGNQIVKQEESLKKLQEQLTTEQGKEDGDTSSIEAKIAKEKEQLGSASNFYMQNEEELRASIEQSREALAAQKETLLAAEGIQEKAAAQVRVNELQSSIAYMSELESNWSEEQMKFSLGVEEARRRANMTEFELFVANLADKRIAEQAETARKVAEKQAEIENLQTQMKKEIDIFSRKQAAIQTMRQIMDSNHSDMMRSQVERTQSAVDAQIEAYRRLAQAAKEAGASSSNITTARISEGATTTGNITRPSSGGTIGSSSTNNQNNNVVINIDGGANDAEEIARAVKDGLTRELRLTQLGSIRA